MFQKHVFLPNMFESFKKNIKGLHLYSTFSVFLTTQSAFTSSLSPIDTLTYHFTELGATWASVSCPLILPYMVGEVGDQTANLLISRQQVS